MWAQNLGGGALRPDSVRRACVLGLGWFCLFVTGNRSIRRGPCRSGDCLGIDLPIVAAGGIVDGAGMAAVFAAGAEGIQMGTRFVSSMESPVHDNFKNTIINSGIDDTYILNKKAKPVIRALKTNLTKEINKKGVMDMTALMNIKKLYFDGDMEAAPALSGQSTGLINKIKSVEQIINEVIKEFNTTCERLSNLKF